MEALAALRILSAALGKLDLKRLNLSDNALGEKGIRACREAFQNQVRVQIGNGNPSFCSGDGVCSQIPPNRAFFSVICGILISTNSS
jgi:hypothetical protein